MALPREPLRGKTSSPQTAAAPAPCTTRLETVIGDIGQTYGKKTQNTVHVHVAVFGGSVTTPHILEEI